MIRLAPRGVDVETAATETRWAITFFDWFSSSR
jgi:hypothetical protein